MITARNCFIALCLALAACKPYHVLQQSGPPSALANIDSMSLRFDHSMLMWGTQTQAEFLARKSSDEELLEIEQVMYGLETGFMNSLPRWTGDVRVHHDEPRPGEILLTVAPMYMRLGKFTYMYDETTELALRCRWSKDGVLLDEIEVQTRVEPSWLQPTSAARVEYAAGLLARFCGSYVDRAR